MTRKELWNLGLLTWMVSGYFLVTMLEHYGAPVWYTGLAPLLSFVTSVWAIAEVTGVEEPTVEDTLQQIEAVKKQMPNLDIKLIASSGAMDMRRVAVPNINIEELKEEFEVSESLGGIEVRSKK